MSEEPASGVAVTDVAEATVVKSNLTTTQSIEQDNAVPSPSPHPDLSPTPVPIPIPIPVPIPVPTPEGPVSGYGKAVGVSSVLIDPDLVDDPTVALLGAKGAVSRLHTMVHNVGSAVDAPVDELKKLFAELGKFLSKL